MAFQLCVIWCSCGGGEPQGSSVTFGHQLVSYNGATKISFKQHSSTRQPIKENRGSYLTAAPYQVQIDALMERSIVITRVSIVATFAIIVLFLLFRCFG